MPAMTGHLQHGCVSDEMETSRCGKTHLQYASLIQESQLEKVLRTAETSLSTERCQICVAKEGMRLQCGGQGSSKVMLESCRSREKVDDVGTRKEQRGKG